MGLTKSNWKVDGKTKEQIEKERQEAVLKSQGHDHKSTTVILCEEHDGRLTIFDKCPFHCVLHECPNKTGIEQNYTSTVSPSTSDSLSPSVHSTDVKIETSWDDGFTFDFKIVELLKKYNLPGTFYIIVDAIGKEGFLTWEQIKDFDKQGFSIGSHTMTHPNDLKDLFEERLFYEIQNSKDIIEAALGHPISKFCYPRGRYDARVKEMVVTGLKGFGTFWATANDAGFDQTTSTRFPMTPRNESWAMNQRPWIGPPVAPTALLSIYIPSNAVSVSTVRMPNFILAVSPANEKFPTPLPSGPNRQKEMFPRSC